MDCSPHPVQNKGEGWRVIEESPLGNHKASDMLGPLVNVTGRHFTDPLEDVGGKIEIET